MDGATGADAVAEDLRLARPLHPAVATVWLNVNDLLGGVPPDRYEAELLSLVRSLRGGGATVLVANTPPLDRLPAYLACIGPIHYSGGVAAAVPLPAPAAIQRHAGLGRYHSLIARHS